MLTRARRAVICTLFSLSLSTSVASPQTFKSPDAPLLAPRPNSETAQFGVIEIDEKRAQGWSDLIDSARLKKQLAALDGSLTYRAGALGFYRVSFEAIGDRNQGAVRVNVTIVGLSGDRTILGHSESVQRWQGDVFLYTPAPRAPQNSAGNTDIPLPPPSNSGDGFGIRLAPGAPQPAVPQEEIRAYPPPFAALIGNSRFYCAPDPNPKREEKPEPRREEKPKIERAPDPAPQPRREEKPKIERAPDPAPEPQRASEPQRAPDPAPEPQRAPEPNLSINSRPQSAPAPNPQRNPAPRPQRAPDPNPPLQARPNFEPPRSTPQRNAPDPNPRPQRNVPDPTPDYGGNRPSSPDPNPPYRGGTSAPDPRPDRRQNLDGRTPGYARPGARPRTDPWDYRYDSYLEHRWNFNFNYSPQNYYYRQNYIGDAYAQARDSFTRSRDTGASQAFEFALIDARSRAEADFNRQLRGEPSDAR